MNSNSCTTISKVAIQCSSKKIIRLVYNFVTNSPPNSVRSDVSCGQGIGAQSYQGELSCIIQVLVDTRIKPNTRQMNGAAAPVRSTHSFRHSSTSHSVMRKPDLSMTPLAGLQARLIHEATRVGRTSRRAVGPQAVGRQRAHALSVPHPIGPR